jgi:hypothetical protein
LGLSSQAITKIRVNKNVEIKTRRVKCFLFIIGTGSKVIERDAQVFYLALEISFYNKAKHHKFFSLEV